MCVEYNKEISIPFFFTVNLGPFELRILLFLKTQKYVRILQELSYGRRNFAKNAFNIAIHCM